jgi:membrane protease YdiL (CAAX protease family)
LGRTKPFFLFLALVVLTVLGTEALFRMGVRTQFYVWEFKFDLNILVIGILCLVFNRKSNVGFGLSKIGIRRWIWRDNILAFISPFFILATIIAIGLLVKAITYQRVDNPSTFLLATIFDIPATFFFSISNVLMEEMVFRGFIFRAISKGREFFISTFLVSILWGIFSLSSLLQDQSSGLTPIFTGFINSLSMGFVCSALLLYSKSIWSSYSFRIGILTFSAALLSRRQEESNTFFASNLASFSGNGIVCSLLFFLLTAILLKLSKNRQII